MKLKDYGGGHCLPSKHCSSVGQYLVCCSRVKHATSSDVRNRPIYVVDLPSRSRLYGHLTHLGPCVDRAIAMDLEQSVQQHPQQQSPRPTSSSSSTVTGVTTLHSAIQETQPATFYNLYLAHWQKLLTPHMLHMDSYWHCEHLILPTTFHVLSF